MERDVAIEQLPETYRRIVRWLDGGVSERDIGLRLDISPESVGPLVAVARAKLDRLLRGERPGLAEPRHRDHLG